MIVKPSPFEGKGDRLRWMRCKRAMKNPPHQSLRDSFPRRRYAKLRFAMLQHSVLLTSKGKPKTKKGHHILTSKSRLKPEFSGFYNRLIFKRIKEKLRYFGCIKKQRSSRKNYYAVKKV